MIRAIWRILPNLLTFIGVLAAGFTAATAPHWWSAIFLILSLLLGGVDGDVAIFQNAANRMGATLDSVADRISEIFWAIAFYRLGVPVAWVFAFAALAAFQEYAKTRLASIEIQNVRLVTLVDRPVRASSLCIAILVYQFTSSHTWVTALAVGLTVLQAVSFLLVLHFASKQLR